MEENGISEDVTLVQLTKSLGNVKHVISIVGIGYLILIVRKHFLWHNHHWI